MLAQGRVCKYGYHKTLSSFCVNILYIPKGVNIMKVTM